MQRKASAVWQGDVKEGKGSISTDSGVLKQVPYSFKARFEDGTVGTSPEELLAAAHAGCFTMALSGALGKAGMSGRLETVATVSIEKDGEGFTIAKSHLDLVAHIPGADKTKFDAAVKAAEKGCPVSKLFKAEITISSKLES